MVLVTLFVVVVSHNLSCAPCWTVHPSRTRHLDLVTIGSSAPMSVTSSLHRAAGRRKLFQKEAKRSCRAGGGGLCQDLDTHTPVWWDWQGSNGCQAQRFALSSPDLPTFVHFLLSNIHSGGQDEDIECENVKPINNYMWLFDFFSAKTWRLHIMRAIFKNRKINNFIRWRKKLLLI